MNAPCFSYLVITLAGHRFLEVAFNSPNHPSKSHGISRSLYAKISITTNKQITVSSPSLARSRAETEEEMKKKENERKFKLYLFF